MLSRTGTLNFQKGGLKTARLTRISMFSSRTLLYAFVLYIFQEAEIRKLRPTNYSACYKTELICL